MLSLPAVRLEGTRVVIRIQCQDTKNLRRTMVTIPIFKNTKDPRRGYLRPLGCSDTSNTLQMISASIEAY